jgi:hypothetical protein
MVIASMGLFMPYMVGPILCYLYGKSVVEIRVGSRHGTDSYAFYVFI